MTQTILNLGTGGAALNGQNGSTAGADSNDAEFLDWPGANDGNYVYLPGVAGNFMEVPNAAALDITGDIDLRAHIRIGALDINQTIIGKGVSFVSTTYLLDINSTGFLRFIHRDGATTRTATSSVALSTVAGVGESVWVRAVRDLTAGEVTFFTGSNGVTWTQLGSVRTGLTGAATSSTNPVRIGHRSTSLDPFVGDIYRAQVLDGIGGTVVLDVDTSVITTGAATSFIAVTGQTVTINRSSDGRKAVAVVSPIWLFGTDDFIQVANSPLLNPNAGEDFTVFIAHRMPSVTTLQAMIGTRTIAVTATHPGWTIRTATTAPAVYVDDGSNISSRAPTTGYSAGSLQVSGFRLSGSTLDAFTNSTFTTTTSRPAGSQANARPLRIGVRADTLLGYVDMEMVGCAVFRRALSNEEINLATDYYLARLS